MTTLYTLLIDVKEDYLLFFMILKVSKRSAAQHRGHRTQDTARKEVRLSFLLKKIRPIFKWSRFVHLRVPADNCGVHGAWEVPYSAAKRRTNRACRSQHRTACPSIELYYSAIYLGKIQRHI